MSKTTHGSEVRGKTRREGIVYLVVVGTPGWYNVGFRSAKHEILKRVATEGTIQVWDDIIYDKRD